MQRTEPKKNWLLNAQAFQKLLEWLDEGGNSDGQKYLEIRRKLTEYFDRKNCRAPEDLTDETLNRVARRIEEEEGAIETETPAKYCYITARFVFLEYLRGANQTNVSLDEFASSRLAATATDEESETKEKRLQCLEKCVSELDQANRDLIVGYYYGAERVKIENRQQMAESLGISANALSIRACRIRERLQMCVKKCQTATDGNS